jgi:hypothetical protein
MTPEDRLQIAASNYLKLQYPGCLWFHPPNGGSRNKIEGAKLKRMGVKPGISDILILEPRKEYSGLAIELKSAKGRATTEQKEFLKLLEERNWRTAIINNLDDFIKTVDEYLAA